MATIIKIFQCYRTFRKTFNPLSNNGPLTHYGKDILEKSLNIDNHVRKNNGSRADVSNPLEGMQDGLLDNFVTLRNHLFKDDYVFLLAI